MFIFDFYFDTKSNSYIGAKIQDINKNSYFISQITNTKEKIDFIFEEVIKKSNYNGSPIGGIRAGFAKKFELGNFYANSLKSKIAGGYITIKLDGKRIGKVINGEKFVIVIEEVLTSTGNKVHMVYKLTMVPENFLKVENIRTHILH